MRKNKGILTLSILFSIFFQTQVFGQMEESIVIGTKIKMKSEILNEERTYILGLPKSYDSSVSKYPVLVLLDADSNFPALSGIIDKMNGRQIPEMIIIGIVNESNDKRTRDFTPTNSIIFLNGEEKPQFQKTSGGSKSFLNFLEKELLPEIDKKYRTNSYKTLVGHSYAGLVAGISYLSDASSFDSYIAIDPSFWWDNQVVLTYIDNANVERLKNKKLYISSAYSYETWKDFGLTRKSHDLFFAELQNKNILTPNLKLQYFEQEDHWTVPTLSFYYGLKFIYADFNMKDLRTSSIEKIVAYYKNRFGGKFSPPESGINRLAYSYLQKSKKEDLDKAIELFQLNASNYPESFNAFDSLAEAYEKIGDPSKALENYKISLKLNPNNENAKRMIETLKNKK